MYPVLRALLAFLTACFRSRASLQLENAMLRHQLAVYQRYQRRLRIHPADRLLWAWVAWHWAGWRETVRFVKPATVIAWQRRRYRDYWAALSHHPRPGGPTVSKEIQALIRKISNANPLWGSPRLVGELRKEQRAEIHRWAYGQLNFFLSYKAKSHGMSVIEVDPRGTSKGCSRCGHTEAANRKRHAFECRACGHRLHADVNAAHNIRLRGILARQALSQDGSLSCGP